MPQNLHPYYLQQMGIETWLLRKPITKSTKLMVVGEALDTKQASSLFCKMLHSIGLTLDDVSLKVRLSDDLIQQITINPPQLLLAVGDPAIRFLLNESLSLSNLRCKLHHYHGVPLVVSYHPNDLLQHPYDKKSAYQDLLYIQTILAQSLC